MTALDINNSIIEFVCSIFMWLNVRSLLIDKKVNGFHWLPTATFFLEYCWNVVYYHQLNQWFSLVAGINIVISNLAWIILALKYRKNK